MSVMSIVGACIVDLSDDVFIMPGLIDPHVHLVLSGTLDPAGILSASDETLLAAPQAAAARAVAAGITTIRDLGDRGPPRVHADRPCATDAMASSGLDLRLHRWTADHDPGAAPAGFWAAIRSLTRSWPESGTGSPGTVRRWPVAGT